LGGAYAWRMYHKGVKGIIKLMSKEARIAAVKALRQSAICTNSAVASMELAARQQNPDKFLRCWTAEQKATKGAGK
jgi:hypothetical protein